MKKENTGVMTAAQIVNLIRLEETHLTLINETVEDLYCDPASPGMYSIWCGKKRDAEERIKNLKEEYKRALAEEQGVPTTLLTGSITVEFKDVPKETISELYRTLNIMFTENYGFTYRTNESRTENEKSAD